MHTYTDLLLQLKLADHAGDRFKERLPGVPAEVLQQAREAVKTIPQGPEARLHLPLMHEGKPVGFAAYKRVGKKGTPVLATILGPDMKPHHSHLLGYPKTAANRMTKILDRAQKLAPKSLLGDLNPADLRTMEQAEAILGNKATSQLGLRTLERPKTHFDAYLSTHKPVPDVASALAEAQNPTTSGDRLKSLLATPHRDVVEAAAVNPNVGAHAGLVHSMRPDLVEANLSTPLHRMMNPEQPLPGMSPAELKGPLSELSDTLRYSFTKGAPKNSPAVQVRAARAASKKYDYLGGRPSYHPQVHNNPVSSHNRLLSTALNPSAPSQQRIKAKFLEEYGKREALKTAAPKTRLYAGLRVRIDRPKGFVQKGKDSQGKSWERTYQCDYGYLAGTQGGDGDGLDVFLGPQEDGKAFLIHQMKEGGGFDEFKLMLGFPDIKSAKVMYTAHVPAKFLGKIQELAVGLIQGLTGRPVDMNKVAQVACGTSFMLGFEAQLKKLA